MLATKSIKAESRPSDGLRISVMSRHTLPDGITKDPEITKDHFDKWWPELAPPGLLVGTYYKHYLGWEEFEINYKIHLTRQEVSAKVIELIEIAKLEIVTLMCIEDKPDQCHRRLLAEYCLLIEPNLEVEIN